MNRNLKGEIKRDMEKRLEFNSIIDSTLADHEEVVQLSPKMEMAIVGSLGMLVIAAPSIIDFILRKAQVIKARVVLLTSYIREADLARKLKMLNRKRKSGSIVRVVGSLLPNAMFTQPYRIYIRGAPTLTNHWDFRFEGLMPVHDPDLPSENDVGDGLIEAFDMDSEVISSLSGVDEDDDSASSTPEGWTQEQRLFANYNPTMKIDETNGICDDINTTDTSFARCSTPKANKRGIQFSMASKQSSSKQPEESNHSEIAELRKTIEVLMMKVNTLETRQLEESTQSSYRSSPPNPPPMLPVITISKPIVQSQSAPAPPPPPPPPPPMPPMPSMENKKLVINRNGNQNKLVQKKPQMSLSDVLKELPNAKLRRVERSPGGTPVKPQLKLATDGMYSDSGNPLLDALRKRYESMHSPTCDTDTDKENADDGSDGDDSFGVDVNPMPSKSVLSPSCRSPRRKVSGGRQENRLPFGQHLLKRRNVQENRGEKSPLASSPLREQN